jgi:hypothetical protein
MPPSWAFLGTASSSKALLLPGLGAGAARTSSPALAAATSTSVLVTELSAGSYFGEMTLVSDMPRTATVTAKERCTLLVLKKPDFQVCVPRAQEGACGDVKK